MYCCWNVCGGPVSGLYGGIIGFFCMGCIGAYVNSPWFVCVCMIHGLVPVGLFLKYAYIC